MQLREFRDLLLSVHPAVHHLESQKETEYIVWREVGLLPLMGDSGLAESGTRIAVDYFTQQEYDTVHIALEKALADHDEICLTDAVVDYDEERQNICYRYTCEVV